MNRNTRHIRPSRLSTPKIFLWLLAIAIIILGAYTVKEIIGPNYDSKYSEMLNAGEVINPAIEYVGVLGGGVMDFVKTEIETSKFLDLDFFKNDEETPEMDNPLDKYEGPPMNDTINPVAGDGEKYIENPPIQDIEELEENNTKDGGIEDELKDEVEEEIGEIVVKDEDKEDMLKYILILIKAYNLHNPPFSSDTPKMEIDMDGEMFNAEVVAGEIYIRGGDIEREDVIISSNWGEAVIMSQGPEYIKNSFASGRTTLEQVCDTKVCFLKGYKEVYDEINS